MAKNIVAPSNFLFEFVRTHALRIAIYVGAVGIILFAITYNLTLFPATWFDEGSHLHVPKTLVQYGVYADYSSEGFRYYGPTIGVGPTVMLPIALLFKLFGVGLLQARLVMAIYLALTIFVFYQLAKSLGNNRFAWVATALLLTSQSVSLVEYGRQTLGEVPALFFLLMGFLLWRDSFENMNPKRLYAAGLMFGLAAVTKSQAFLVLMPTFGVALLLNAVLRRLRKTHVPVLTFLLPAAFTLGSYLLWQLFVAAYLGPSTAQENVNLLREATAGAALAFSPAALLRATKELLSQRAYTHVLVPALVYFLLLFWVRSKQSLAITLVREQKSIARQDLFWCVLFIFIVINLAWYMFASIGWVRYAFPGLALAALFVARLFYDLTDGFAEFFRPLSLAELQESWLQWLVAATLVFVVGLNGFALATKIVHPEADDAHAIAQFLNERVPKSSLIETWEPELGVLTDHNFKYPPNSLLAKAVANKWHNAPSAAQFYNFLQPAPPSFVLIGNFGRWVQIYPPDLLARHYHLVTTIGRYELYERGNWE